MSERTGQRQKEGELLGNKKFNPNKVLEALFHKLLPRLLKIESNDPDFLVKLQKKHAIGVFRQRRIEAMLRLMPVLMEKCFPPSTNFVKERLISGFFESEVIPGFDYNAYDGVGVFRLGAIIWILDNLKRAGNLEKAIDQLPYFGNPEGSPFLPKNFYHPCYSNSLIESMMFVMTMRFESSQERALKSDLVVDNILTEANVEGRQYNAAFQKIIELLPQDVIERVCNDFRDKILETVRLFMDAFISLKNKEASCIQYIEEAKKTSYNVLSIDESKPIGPVASPRAGASLKNFGLMAPSGVLMNPVNFAGRNDELTDTINYLKRLGDNISEYTIVFQYFFHDEREQLQEYFDDKVIEDMFLNYSVGDPFAMCFALIYLADHGDDYPWLFMAGGCVMNEVLLTLPWGEGKGKNVEEKRLLNRVFNEVVDFAPEGWLNKKFDSVDCSSRKNGNKGSNIAQAFYRLTGCILPSGIPNPFEINKEFSSWRLSPFENGFLSGTAYSLYLSSQQARLPEEIDSIDSEETEEDDSGSENDSDNARKEAAIADLNGKLSEVNKSREDLQAEILRVRRELKSLKRTAAEDRKRFAAEILQKDEELHKARLEHRELIDLREMMFHIANKDNSLDSSQEADNINFPYVTNKRVVVFGGHPTFLKQLKGYLPNVRFVDVDNIAFNPDIVRNADVVWIQNNFMSHSQFYNVVNTARQYSVQIRYFTYSSAEKSAIQVVEDDMSSKL